MRPRGLALGLRAQLLLVLTVLLVIPWLGVAYVRELDSVLRAAQERTLAGTAQAVATALHERPRLFDTRIPGVDAPAQPRDATVPIPHPDAVAEIAQILHGLTRTTASIFVVDRAQNVLARAGTLKPPPPEEDLAGIARVERWLQQHILRPLYTLVLTQPSEAFVDDPTLAVAADAREIEGALGGILTVGRRRTTDDLADVVLAAHPIWVGDSVRGAVVVEETTNAIVAERNRAFERLFTIVIATMLISTLALTVFASRLSARIRRLRNDAERAIDPQGRPRPLQAEGDTGAAPPFAAVRDGDEIGDLARTLESALDRLAQYAGYQQHMASRLSHELRTPVAVVRSSLDNMAQQALPHETREVIERAQSGLNRLSAILARMTEATRLEQGLASSERERFDLVPLIAGCVDGYRTAFATHHWNFERPAGPAMADGVAELVAQMLDKLAANAAEFASPGTPIVVRLETDEGEARLSVVNDGPLLPVGLESRLFDSMVSVRSEGRANAPHLGLGLTIVRLIAEFHGGTARIVNRPDGRGVVATVRLPLAPA